MKVALLAAANSIHTIRWANGLVERGLTVNLISAHESTIDLDSRVNLHILKKKLPWSYVTAVFEVKALLLKIQPNFINVHYATGYGVLARLVNFKLTILSVWGSDVYVFPEKSFFHRWLLKGNLKTVDAIAATSHCMARKVAEIFEHKSIFITPFGIDEQLFLPSVKPDELKDYIVLGTVKTLKHVYGIDILICSFSQVWKKLGRPKNLVLEISGGGEDLEKLKKLALSLGVQEQIYFYGHIPHNLVPRMLNRLDIYCAFSRSESFGVAILEASACEKPVITSDAEGLVEVMLHGKTGLVIPKENVEGFSMAMYRLILDERMRHRMGKAGRAHILSNYTWSKSLDLMIETYRLVKEGQNVADKYDA
jgi:glycosyltransferase involved in cell wall biosynthesis